MGTFLFHEMYIKDKTGPVSITPDKITLNEQDQGKVILLRK